jgi:hypothetical protein
MIIDIIVKDGSNGEEVTVRRIDRSTYFTPPGHDPRAISRAIVQNDDPRYSYIGAIVYPTF